MTSGFGQKIAALLDERGLTQASFAKKAGFSQASVSLYIHGKRHPNIESLRAMAVALDVPPSYLIFDGDITQEELGYAVEMIVENADRLTSDQLRDLAHVLEGRQL